MLNIFDRTDYPEDDIVGQSSCFGSDKQSYLSTKVSVNDDPEGSTTNTALSQRVSTINYDCKTIPRKDLQVQMDELKEELQARRIDCSSESINQNLDRKF